MEGRYANYFEIGHNVFEFVADFGQLYPGAQPPVIHTRVIIGPAYAKQLLEVLVEAIDDYEKRFGKLVEDVSTDAQAETHKPPRLALVAVGDRPLSAASSPEPGHSSDDEVSTMADNAKDEPRKSPKQAIDDLQQKIDQEQSDIAAKNRDLTSDQQKLAVSQSTWDDVQQTLDDYSQALPNLKTQRADLSTYLNAKLEVIRRILGDDKAKKVEVAIKAVDDGIADAAKNADGLAKQRDASAAAYDKAQQTFAGRRTDLENLRKFRSNLEAGLADSTALRTKASAVDDENQPSRAYFLALELQRVLAGAVVAEAADYQQQLVDAWWRLADAQDPLAGLKAKADADNDKYEAAKASAADQAGNRTDTLLAKMDELDAAKAPAPAPADEVAV